MTEIETRRAAQQKADLETAEYLEIMNRRARDFARENLARTAWLLSAHVTEKDITGIACRIAGDTGIRGESQSIRDAILDGLESMSDERQGDKGNRRGHCDMGETECYWWHNNAESDWCSDKPEWWDEQS